MSRTPDAVVLVQDEVNHTWTQITTSWESVLDKQSGRTEVIFMPLKPVLDDLSYQKKLSSDFGIPAAFWSDTCTRLNGFFGCSISPHSNAPLVRCDTWFRLIIKELPPESGPDEYEWIEMSFASHWCDESNVLICFDAPADLPGKFEAAFPDEHSGAVLGPYSLHILLMQLIIPTYDQSIWDIAIRVRNIEKNRNHMDETVFPGLHEVARHTAHATETVQMASNVLNRMASRCEALAQRQSGDDAEAMYERLEILRFQHSMMQGIAARSMSNEKRLSNEINLMFNMMAQKDNDVNIDIARATRIDSAAMKTIAVVTLTFLPATYVSALLGMNLFSYDPDAHGGQLMYSQDLWIYFIVSVPLTGAILGFWWVWQHRYEQKLNGNGSDIEERASVSKQAIS